MERAEQIATNLSLEFDNRIGARWASTSGSQRTWRDLKVVDGSEQRRISVLQPGYVKRGRPAAQVKRADVLRIGLTGANKKGRRWQRSHLRPRFVARLR